MGPDAQGGAAARAWFRGCLPALGGVLLLLGARFGRQAAPILGEPTVVALAFGLTLVGLGTCAVGAARVARQAGTSGRWMARTAQIL